MSGNVDDRAAHRGQAHDEKASAGGRCRTVLLISTDNDLAAMLRAMLSAYGDEWDITCSSDRSAAWAQLDSCAVCLLDAWFPDALTFLVRAKDSLRLTPIVWFGDDGELSAAAVQQSGATDSLTLELLDSRLLVRALRYACEKFEADRLLREGDRRLRETTQAMQDLLAEYSDALLVLDRTGRTVYANLAAARLFGRDPFAMMIEDYPPLVLHQAGVYEIEMALGDRDRTLIVQLYDISWKGDAASLLSLRDITSQRAMERHLLLAYRVITASRSGVFVADSAVEEAPIIFVNPAFERITGYALAEVEGRPALSVLGNEIDLEVADQFGRAVEEGLTFQATTRVERKDGKQFWADTSLAPVHDNSGQITHFVGIYDDVTERVSSRQRLEWLTTHHSLCGLYNQHGLRPVADARLSAARENGDRLVVLWVNVDDFHLVNEVYGHEMGDAVIVEMASRLRFVVGNTAILGRIDGEEFVIFVSEGDCGGNIGKLTELVCREMSRPFAHAGLEIRVTCRVGLSIDDGKDDAMKLARSADIAMHQVRPGRGGGMAFFTPEMASRPQRLVSMRGDLQRAVERGEFVVAYQPQVDARSGRIAGVEALVRWQHPKHGLLMPGQFLPDAEHTGHADEIGNIVLARACLDCAMGMGEGLGDLVVSVNVSSRQFHSDSFITNVERILRESGLPPERLELELNDSALPEDVDRALQRLSALRGMGVRIALDNFGRSTSDIGHLQYLPVNKIKIDRSFTQHITSDSRAAAIVGGVVAMGHNLGLVVVAEGVETEGQRDYLRKLSCDLFQGYLFSEPVLPSQVCELAGRFSTLSCFGVGAAQDESASTLLLVDDEPNILRALSRLLRRDGYRIFTAASANDAFAILASNDVQVIISDQRMPEICGTDFLAQVKGLYPDTIRIVLSGYTDLKSVTAAINEGAIWRYLTKPWHDEELREDVRKAFSTYYIARSEDRYHG